MRREAPAVLMETRDSHYLSLKMFTFRSHQDGGSLNFKNSNRSRSESLEYTSVDRYTYVPHTDKVQKELTSPAKRSDYRVPNTVKHYS